MNKHLVLIVSGGRTGTRFFGDLLASVVDDCFSVHEPDLFEGFTRRTWDRLKVFGFNHMIFGRISGRTGIRNLTQRYLSGELDDTAVDAAIRRHREAYYASIPTPLIVESYYAWFGLLPAVQRVFPGCRIVAIVRDPRTWVRSWLQFGGHHDRKDLVRWFGQKRLEPTMLGDTKFDKDWPHMSRFEKLCWDWRTINTCLADFVDADPDANLYRYEDLFLAEDRIESVAHMLDFMTQFADRQYGYSLDGSILERRVHASRQNAFPSWTDWSPEMARSLSEICGPLMKRFDYGAESAWSNLIQT